MESPNAGMLALNLRRLRLRHMEVLLALERHGSLTAAADALGVTQPAVSQWLADLEAALGVPLFVRGRQIRPSPYLPLALRLARRMVADSQRLAQEIDAVASGSGGLVRIGSMPVASAGLLPAALIGLRASPLSVEVRVTEDIAAGLWPRFERRELDLIVGRLDQRAFAPNLRREALRRDPHRVVAGRAHPLHARPDCDWAAAAAYPWLLPPRDTVLRRAIDLTFVEHGLPPPSPWLETTSITLNQVLMNSLPCLCVISGAAADHHAAQGAMAPLPLSLSSEVGPIGMVWDAQEPAPALAHVLQALRQSASTIRDNRPAHM